MRKPVYTSAFNCPVSAAADIIGGKWKVVILYHLFGGPKRYNELRRLLPEATQRMLTLQLRELELDGIVHREIYKEIPPKVDGKYPTKWTDFAPKHESVPHLVMDSRCSSSVSVAMFSIPVAIH